VNPEHVKREQHLAAALARRDDPHVSCLPVSRAGRIHWAVFVFLVGFAVLLIGVISYTLVPGLEAATQPKISDDEKRRLVAWYRLLLAVILLILFAGLVLTFRFGRMFFPRPLPPRTQTKYVDAWEESAKRVHVPPAEEDEREDGG
jgi:hypothetical protein